MAEITVFQGVRYNQDTVKNMNDVICPPYDIISPEEQKMYYEKNEYNVIRLEHGIVNPTDTERDNKYTRASSTLLRWFRDGILKVDNDHTFYIYEQGFTYRKSFKKRFGLIACVRLEEFAKKVVFPHEATAAGIKTDRLQLMRATNADISPILSLYDDPGQKVTKLMTDKMLPGRLLININNADETHRVWKANEPEFVQRVSHFMLPKSIYIADGHHRYETALAYRNERSAHSVSHGGNEAYNFILMTLVSFTDPGIVMLPVHRLIKKLPLKTLQDFNKHMTDYFEVTVSPITEAGIEDRKGTDIRVLGLEEDKIVNLKPRNPASLRQLMPPGHSQAYYSLDLSILDHVILEVLFGGAIKEGNLVYTPYSEQALQLVKEGNFK